MKMVKEKIFYNYENGKRSFKLVKYDDSQVEYYKFIKENQRKGYYQLIINSRLMIDLIKCFANSELNLVVYDIELAEEDNEYIAVLRSLMQDYKNKREKIYFSTLLEKLNILYQDNSIEITKISLGNKLNDVMIHSNGIIEVNTDAKNKVNYFVKNKLIKIIQ